MNPKYLPFIQEKDGKPCTFIPVAPQGEKLPAYLFQGNKQPLWYVVDDTITPLYWTNIVPAQGMQCIYFEEMHLESFETLASSHRADALPLMRNFAKALMTLGKDLVNVENGILPLWRIWIVKEGGFLLLSRTVSDLISSALQEDGRHEGNYAWSIPRTNPAFTLCHQFTQLLYHAIMGFPPFYMDDTREDKYKFFPIPRTDENEANNKTASWINSVLNMPIPRQQDAVGNKHPVEGLIWWLESTDALEWNYQQKTPVAMIDAHKDIEEAQEKNRQFFQAQKRRADRRRFWRQKGSVITIATIILVAVSWFTIDRIQAANAPPQTANMEPVAIVVDYYEGQNGLDITRMEDALAKGVKSPLTYEVTNLFVSSRMRLANENINPQITPEEWIAQGRGPIPSTYYIYGVTDLHIEQLDDYTWRATTTLYTPYQYDSQTTTTAGSALEIPTSVTIYVYEQVTDFTFRIAKKGWWEIASISPAHVVLRQVIEVPYSQDSGTSQATF